MLKLVFMTEEEEEQNSGKCRKYTDQEANEIIIAAHSLEDMIKIMHCYCMDTQNDFGEEIFLSVFGVMGWMINPITKFLSDNQGNYKKEDAE